MCCVSAENDDGGNSSADCVFALTACDDFVETGGFGGICGYSKGPKDDDVKDDGDNPGDLVCIMAMYDAIDADIANVEAANAAICGGTFSGGINGCANNGGGILPTPSQLGSSAMP